MSFNKTNARCFCCEQPIRGDYFCFEQPIRGETRIEGSLAFVLHNIVVVFDETYFKLHLKQGLLILIHYQSTHTLTL